MSNTSFNYDTAFSNADNYLFPNISEQFIDVDKYGEKRIMTDFKPRAVDKEDELFLVFIKKNLNTIIFNLDQEEILKKTNQYLVRAEDVCEFIFDEKDSELIWCTKPIYGKDLME